MTTTGKTGRVVRWQVAVVAAGLFVLLAALSLQAIGMWDLGVFDLPVRWMYRMSEVALVPFTLVARSLFPPHNAHHTLGFFLSRTVIAAVFYAVVLSWLWRFLRRCFTGLTRDLNTGADAEVGRRRFVGGGLAITAGAATLGACGWVTVVVPARLRLRTYRVAIDSLPPDLDGFRIAHLTDTHLGPFISAGHILEAIALANGTGPDLTVLTGDYVHRTPDAVEPGIGLFSRVRARLGAVAVLGNHDHWEGADACRRRFDSLSIPLIDNTRLFVTPEGLRRREVEGKSLAVCGVGDLWEDAVDLEAALSGVSTSCPRILLCHNPDFAERATGFSSELRVDLQLSGHTHGGQVSLPAVGAPLVPSRYGDKYAGGLVAGPRWPVIVSRGVGMAVLPVRLGVEPEVGLIELVRSS